MQKRFVTPGVYDRWMKVLKWPMYLCITVAASYAALSWVAYNSYKNTLIQHCNQLSFQNVVHFENASACWPLIPRNKRFAMCHTIEDEMRRHEVGSAQYLLLELRADSCKRTVSFGSVPSFWNSIGKFGAYAGILIVFSMLGVAFLALMGISWLLHYIFWGNR